MTPEQARALYLKGKRGNRPSLIAKAKGRAVYAAKADAKARNYIERMMGGATIRQIAEAVGSTPDAVRSCIKKYRHRHPDTPLSLGPDEERAA